MKVLFVAYSWHPFEWPVTKFMGGTEAVEADQIHALLELGHEVTVMVTEDARVEGLDTIRVPIKSKVGGKIFYMAKMIDAIFEHHSRFDVILTNTAWGSPLSDERKEGFKRIASKLRMVNHAPFGTEKSRDGVGKLISSRYLVSQGAKVATVYEDGGLCWDAVETDLREGRMYKKEAEGMLSKLVKGPTFTGFYEAMRVRDDFRSIEEIAEGSKFVFVGRPNPIKGGLLVLRAFKKLGMLDDLLYFTTSPSSPAEEEEFSKITSLKDDVLVNQPHSEIMAAMSTARCFLQPTKGESAGGIVGFEAACHGVPVLTSSVWSDRFLKPYGVYNGLESRDVKSLVEGLQAVKPLSTDERRSIATRVREDFSQDVYRSRLQEFLEG